MVHEIIVDGEDAVFGRLASFVAKQLLEGNKVIVVNAEKIVLTGNPNDIVEKYKTRRAFQHKGTPEYSPKWPRVPYMLVKRMIRGMLPYRKSSGRAAYRRLRVYQGVPKELEGKQAAKLEHAQRSVKKHLTIKELCVKLGWNE